MTNDLLILSDSLGLCISVTSYLVDQVVGRLAQQVAAQSVVSVTSYLVDQVADAGVAAVGNAFEPAQCLALVDMLPRQSHQVLLRCRKLGAP